MRELSKQNEFNRLNAEIDRLTKENEAFRNTTRFRNLEEENAKLRRRVEWPRCNEDTGEGIVCNAELVDGGEGIGMFCPLCELREGYARLKEYSESLSDNTMLKLERIGLLEEMSALLEDRPLPNGNYIHVLTCNASRLEPVGNEMCSCPIGRRIKRSDR